MNRTLLIVLILAFTSTTTVAEKFKMKFGKVNLDQLKMTSYAQDTSANSVILADVGKSYFIYDNSMATG